MNKEEFFKFWQKREVQIAIDICRVLLVIIALLILATLASNINEVKTLSLDPCLICMNKTGATCFMPQIPQTLILTIK